MVPKTKSGDMEAFITGKYLTIIQGEDIVTLNKSQFIELKHFTDFEDF